MDRRGELLEVIRSVRNRWRQRLAVRGAVVVVAGTLLALFLSASSLQALRFSPSAIITFRFVAVGVFIALVWYFLARSMRRRVSDTQVAMYLEENDPTLEAAILSAIEATSDSTIAKDHSPRAGRAARRAGDRAVPVARARARGRSAGAQTSRDDARRRRRGRGAAHSARPRLSAAGPVGAAHRHARRREIEPLLDRSPARQREGAARIRSGGERPARRVHVEGRDADGAHLARRGVRAHPARGRHQPRGVRGHALSPRKGHRVFRRSQRRAFADLHDERPRPADGRQARARVSLPRLHRPAGAEGGDRRRHRRAARHRSLDARDADDGDRRAGRFWSTSRATTC